MLGSQAQRDVLRSDVLSTANAKYIAIASARPGVAPSATARSRASGTRFAECRHRYELPRREQIAEPTESVWNAPKVAWIVGKLLFRTGIWFSGLCRGELFS